MPRRFDGPMLEQIPQKVLDNALSGRVGDLLDRILGNADRPGDGAHSGAGFEPHGPVLGDLFNHGRPTTPPGADGSHGGQPRDHVFFGGQGAAPDGAPTVQTWHDLNPGAGDVTVQTWHDLNPDAGEARAAQSGDAALQHFELDADLGRHLDHFNSQALSMHPDWFML